MNPTLAKLPGGVFKPSLRSAGQQNADRDGEAIQPFGRLRAPSSVEELDRHGAPGASRDDRRFEDAA
jgi:hypothetical protein